VLAGRVGTVAKTEGASRGGIGSSPFQQLGPLARGQSKGINKDASWRRGAGLQGEAHMHLLALLHLIAVAGGSGLVGAEKPGFKYWQRYHRVAQGLVGGGLPALAQRGLAQAGSVEGAGVVVVRGSFLEKGGEGLRLAATTTQRQQRYG
jgi:hypothetical protein